MNVFFLIFSQFQRFREVRCYAVLTTVLPTYIFRFRLTLLGDSRVFGVDVEACAPMCCDRTGEGTFFSKMGDTACHVYKGRRHGTHAGPLQLQRSMVVQYFGLLSEAP